MTKEEILDKHLEGSCCDRNDGGYIDQYGVYENIEDAMEEYAKQCALEFERFLVKGYTYEKANGFWYNIEKQHEGAEAFDREELYNLYLQSKL